MRPTYTVLPLLLACGLAWGQTATLPAAASSAKAQRDTTAKSQERIHIRVEDAGARIDEIRVGGDTQSIIVQPKDGMPAYQVEPKTGERSWKVLGF